MSQWPGQSPPQPDPQPGAPQWAAQSYAPHPAHIAYAAARPQIENDRRGGLIAFGVVSILIGSLAGCLAMLTPVSLAMMSFAPAAARDDVILDLIVATVFYAAAATLFIWTGIGSIRCRRWVRPIVISLGWPTIIAGVLGLAGWVFFARDLPAVLAMAAQTPATPPVPGAPAPPPPAVPSSAGIAAIMAVVLAVFYLILPGAFVWFYSTQTVKRTLEAYDPRTGWTERAPLPVFAGAVNLALGGLMTLSLATAGAVPVFGHFLEGAPAALLVVAVALVMFAAAVLFYRVKFLGWFLAVAVVTFGFLSALITFSYRGIAEFYTRGRADPDVLRVIERSPTMTGVTPIVFMAVTFLICITYLIWVRPYFTRHRFIQDPQVT